MSGELSDAENGILRRRVKQLEKELATCRFERDKLFDDFAVAILGGKDNPAPNIPFPVDTNGYRPQSRSGQEGIGKAVEPEPTDAKERIEKALAEISKEMIENEGNLMRTVKCRGIIIRILEGLQAILSGGGK